MGDMKVLALSVLECGLSVLDPIDPLQCEKNDKNVIISHCKLFIINRLIWFCKSSVIRQKG